MRRVCLYATLCRSYDPSRPKARQVLSYDMSLLIICSDIHHPSIETADALGYPRPIVDHAEARKRALRRLKNIGEA